MSDPHFFGYGSLVNTNTHSYPHARPATLHGWRRAWVRTDLRDIVFLTGVPAPGHSIAGLIAAVPNNDWAALDLRESGYARVPATDAVTVDRAPHDIAVYAVPPEDMRSGGDHRILLSYLDVVVQGYLRVFGTQGVADFFDTTDGWSTPILNDRASPLYPRAQSLNASETALVDHHLHGLSAQVQNL
ncbi:gamma-glutamylcyclotransferase family protein [Ascidiaceihabitans sp.]|uniref:gamma-glutamylcyclotransferase family protein n=1 Tax=Ascidiaceihabitans sp. TaxID=1872644 RepID=UPI00329A7147